MKTRKLRVAAVVPGVIPSTLLCVMYPLLRLERAGALRAEILHECYSSIRSCAGIDVGVFCRNFEPFNRGFVDHFIAAGVPYVYDIDDNLLAISKDTPGGAYYHDGGRPEMLRHYISHAALVRVYSPSMLAEISGLTDRARLVQTPIEWSMIEKPRRRRAGPVRLVYATSRNEDALSLVFMEALERILAEYGDAVRMHFIGYNPPNLRGKPNVVQSPFMPDYERFVRSFCSAGYDIGLAPMVDDLFHRGKTNNKFREYGAARIAGIYSDVPLYAASVEPGETGILVHNTPAAWYDAMKTLIDDATLRKKIQERAWGTLRQHYRVEEFDGILLQQITLVAGKNPAPAQHQHPASAPSVAVRSPGLIGRMLALRPQKIIPLLFFCQDWMRWPFVVARLRWRNRS